MLVKLVEQVSEFTSYEREVEFNAWLDSIEFMAKTGSISSTYLTEDLSDDVEGDREG